VEALRPLAAAAPPPRPTARPTTGPGNLRRPDNGMPGRPGKPNEPPGRAGAAAGKPGAPGKGSAPAVPAKGGSPAAPGKKSQPTLRPQEPATGRKSLRESISSPAPVPKRELPPEEDEEVDDPEDSADDEEDEDDDEEEEGDEEEGGGSRVNTTVVTVLAVLACTLAFWVALRWFTDQPIWPFVAQ
jgi:hypothetical protein